MSQKTNPIIFRLGIKRTWLTINHVSNWFKPWGTTHFTGPRVWLEFCIRRLIKGIFSKKGWYTSEVVIKSGQVKPKMVIGAIVVKKMPKSGYFLWDWRKWRKWRRFSNKKLRLAKKIAALVIKKRYNLQGGVKIATRVLPKVEADATIFSSSIRDVIGPNLKRGKRTGELRSDRKGSVGGYLRKLWHQRRNPTKGLVNPIKRR